MVGIAPLRFVWMGSTPDSMELFGRVKRMKNMGEIRASVMLKNDGDLVRCELGQIPGDQVRAVEIEAVVDTGAVMILLPQELVEKLGLRPFERSIVVMADDRKIEMDRAGTLMLTVCGRSMKTDCLVGPPGCEPLIGQLVLEALDLIPDPGKRTLSPRPESPFLPTLKMKQGRPASPVS